LPFSKIDEMGAGMYKGKKITRGNSLTAEHPVNQSEGGVQFDLAAQKVSSKQDNKCEKIVNNA